MTATFTLHDLKKISTAPAINTDEFLKKENGHSDNLTLMGDTTIIDNVEFEADNVYFNDTDNIEFNKPQNVHFNYETDDLTLKMTALEMMQDIKALKDAGAGAGGGAGGGLVNADDYIRKDGGQANNITITGGQIKGQLSLEKDTVLENDGDDISTGELVAKVLENERIIDEDVLMLDNDFDLDLTDKNDEDKTPILYVNDIGYKYKEKFYECKTQKLCNLAATITVKNDDITIKGKINATNDRSQNNELAELNKKLTDFKSEQVEKNVNFNNNIQQNTNNLETINNSITSNLQNQNEEINKIKEDIESLQHDKEEISSKVIELEADHLMKNEELAQLKDRIDQFKSCTCNGEGGNASSVDIDTSKFVQFEDDGSVKFDKGIVTNLIKYEFNNTDDPKLKGKQYDVNTYDLHYLTKNIQFDENENMVMKKIIIERKNQNDLKETVATIKGNVNFKYLENDNDQDTQTMDSYTICKTVKNIDQNLEIINANNFLQKNNDTVKEITIESGTIKGEVNVIGLTRTSDLKTVVDMVFDLQHNSELSCENIKDINEKLINKVNRVGDTINQVTIQSGIIAKIVTIEYANGSLSLDTIINNIFTNTQHINSIEKSLEENDITTKLNKDGDTATNLSINSGYIEKDVYLRNGDGMIVSVAKIVRDNNKIETEKVFDKLDFLNQETERNTNNITNHEQSIQNLVDTYLAKNKGEGTNLKLTWNYTTGNGDNTVNHTGKISSGILSDMIINKECALAYLDDQTNRTMKVDTLVKKVLLTEANYTPRENPHIYRCLYCKRKGAADFYFRLEDDTSSEPPIIFQVGPRTSQFSQNQYNTVMFNMPVIFKSSASISYKNENQETQYFNLFTTAQKSYVDENFIKNTDSKLNNSIICVPGGRLNNFNIDFKNEGTHLITFDEYRADSDGQIPDIHPEITFHQKTIFRDDIEFVYDAVTKQNPSNGVTTIEYKFAKLRDLYNKVNQQSPIQGSDNFVKVVNQLNKSLRESRNSKVPASGKKPISASGKKSKTESPHTYALAAEDDMIEEEEIPDILLDDGTVITDPVLKSWKYEMEELFNYFYDADTDIIDMIITVYLCCIENHELAHSLTNSLYANAMEGHMHSTPYEDSILAGFGFCIYPERFDINCESIDGKNIINLAISIPDLTYYNHMLVYIFDNQQNYDDFELTGVKHIFEIIYKSQNEIEMRSNKSFEFTSELTEYSDITLLELHIDCNALLSTELPENTEYYDLTDIYYKIPPNPIYKEYIKSLGTSSNESIIDQELKDKVIELETSINQLKTTFEEVINDNNERQNRDVTETYSLEPQDTTGEVSPKTFEQVLNECKRIEDELNDKLWENDKIFENSFNQIELEIQDCALKTDLNGLVTENMLENYVEHSALEPLATKIVMLNKKN